MTEREVIQNSLQWIDRVIDQTDAYSDALKQTRVGLLAGLHQIEHKMPWLKANKLSADGGQKGESE